jgi:hypothetical protein
MGFNLVFKVLINVFLLIPFSLDVLFIFRNNSHVIALCIFHHLPYFYCPMPHLSFILFHIHQSSILKSYYVSIYDFTLSLPFVTYRSFPFLLITVTKLHTIASSVCPFYHVNSVWSVIFGYFSDFF